LENTARLEFLRTTDVARVQIPVRRSLIILFGQVHMLEYRETLPASCPPGDAYEIKTDLEVFRLVSKFPPSDNDFDSQRALKPKAVFSFSECDARGVSVWTKMEDVLHAKKLPKFNGNKSVVCKVRLHGGAGRIKQTGSNSSHKTWWPYKEYDIISRCEAIS